MEITIYDFAEPIDFSIIKSRELDDLKAHGLGVYFYKTMSDKVKYFYSKDKGNAIQLFKYLKPKR